VRRCDCFSSSCSRDHVSSSIGGILKLEIIYIVCLEVYVVPLIIIGRNQMNG